MWASGSRKRKRSKSASAARCGCSGSMVDARQSMTHQPNTGPHSAVAVSCGLGLGNTWRAVAGHGAGKNASTAGRCITERRQSRNADARKLATGSAAFRSPIKEAEASCVARKSASNRVKACSTKSLRSRWVFRSAATVRGGCSAKSASCRTSSGSSRASRASCTGFNSISARASSRLATPRPLS